MGSYTAVVTQLTLKQDTPKDVLEMLRLLVLDTSDDWKTIIDFQANTLKSEHEFFSTDSWYGLFSNFTGAAYCRFKLQNDPVAIDCVSVLKAHDQLVEKFYSWISPFVDETKPTLLMSIPDEPNTYDGHYRAYLHKVSALKNTEVKGILDYLDIGGVVVLDTESLLIKEMSTADLDVADNYGF